jgi:hypothetical protein
MNPLDILSLREKISRIMVMIRRRMDADIDAIFFLASEDDAGPAVLARCLSAIEAHRVVMGIIVSFYHSTYVEGEDCEDVLTDIAKMWEDDVSSAVMLDMSDSEVSAGLLRVMRDHWDDHPVC